MYVRALAACVLCPCNYRIVHALYGLAAALAEMTGEAALFAHDHDDRHGVRGPAIHASGA